MKQRVYAMCGLAFSGKSTVARRVATELGAELISLDAINHERGLRGGEGIPVEEWERTSHIAMERVQQSLSAGRSVVVDDTFSHRFLRDRCRAVAENGGARFLVLHMQTPLDVIEERRRANRLRPTRHDVREDVFTAHRDGFQHPGDDEPVVHLVTEADVARWIAGEANSN